MNDIQTRIEEGRWDHFSQQKNPEKTTTAEEKETICENIAVPGAWERFFFKS